ncbi:MAG: hypothetical protein KA885_04580 [Spirochaetes bacterium]|nr:hypothetical protein [Spirochaetota bacterium]
MNKKITFLIFGLIFLYCCNCSNEIDPGYYPIFDGINADENTIYFVNRSNDEVHKIYAVDTKKENKIYTYEFDRRKFSNVIYSMVYDVSFDINPYFVFMNGDALKLDVRSGKFIKFDIDYYAGSIAIVDSKLWITPDVPGLENTPVSYFTYDDKYKKTEYIILPEGIFYWSWGRINNIYISIYYAENYSNIYNLTTNQMKRDVFNKKYYIYNFFCNNYLVAWNLDIEKDGGEIYFINSFEPELDYKYLFSINTDELVFAEMFEDENYIYLVSREYIIKRNKNNNYDVEKNVRFNNKDSLGFYCKNGYIWLTCEDYDGAYKVNMDDLSYEIIK